MADVWFRRSKTVGVGLMVMSVVLLLVNIAAPESVLSLAPGSLIFVVIGGAAAYARATRPEDEEGAAGTRSEHAGLLLAVVTAVAGGEIGRAATGGYPPVAKLTVIAVVAALALLGACHVLGATSAQHFGAYGRVQRAAFIAARAMMVVAGVLLAVLVYDILK